MGRRTVELVVESSSALHGAPRFDLFVDEEAIGYGDVAADVDGGGPGVELRVRDDDYEIRRAGLGADEFDVWMDGELEARAFLSFWGGSVRMETSWGNLSLRRVGLFFGRYRLRDDRGRRLGWLAARRHPSMDLELEVDESVEDELAAIVLSVVLLARRRWWRVAVDVLGT